MPRVRISVELKEVIETAKSLSFREDLTNSGLNLKAIALWVYSAEDNISVQMFKDELEQSLTVLQAEDEYKYKWFKAFSVLTFVFHPEGEGEIWADAMAIPLPYRCPHCQCILTYHALRTSPWVPGDGLSFPAVHCAACKGRVLDIFECARIAERILALGLDKDDE